MGILVNQGKQLATLSGGIHLLAKLDIFEQVKTQVFSGRTQEFDEHRAYHFGDDIRDIDWKATAKAGTLLIKKFLPFKEHSLLLVADLGKGMAASAPNGETKLTLARYALSLAGIVALSNNFDIAFSYGDATGSHRLRIGKGEKHLEHILEMIDHHNPIKSALNDPVSQLRFIAKNYSKPSLIVFATQSPIITEELKEIIRIIRAKHGILWIICEDMELLSENKDLDDAYDLLANVTIFRKGMYRKKLYENYLINEERRRQIVHEAFQEMGIRYIRIGSGLDILPQLMSIYRKKSDR